MPSRRLLAARDWPRPVLTRCLSIALSLALLAAQTPAAPPLIAGTATEWRLGLLFWLRASGWTEQARRLLAGRPRPAPAQQERQSARDSRVSGLRIYPGDVTVRAGERVVFSAVATDSEGAPIGGVSVSWSGVEAGQNRPFNLSPTGQFNTSVAGTYIITAEAAGERAHATVTVTDQQWPGARRAGRPLSTREVSTRDLKKVSSIRLRPRKGAQTVTAAAPLLDGAVLARASLAGATPAASPSPLLPPDDYEWSDSNYWSADDPGNERGNPPGRPEADGAGSSNFQLAAPVITLPGRGLDLSLTLSYNSRLWHKAGSNITFDIDHDWPAPGWSLGFGKMALMGLNSGSMLVDADGTRHAYAGTVTTYYPGTTYFSGHTIDGTFIDYTHYTSNGAITWGEARYPNGTVIVYGAPGQGAVYPTQITDATGNYITITYRNNAGPNIETVKDTLGRVISFHYDASNLLTAITAPGLGGGVRPLVRLQYQWLTLDYSFSGVNPLVRTATVPVMRAIYYPATATGYWFGDGDSYSSYGMIARVSEQRAMGFTSAPLTEQGVITPGAVTRQAIYNYPLSPVGGLADAPAYTQLIETWDGMDTAAAVTTYDVRQEEAPRRIEITRPDGTRHIQYAYNNPGAFNDGLVYRDETYAGSTLLQTSTVVWEQGAYGAPRPARTEVTDERNQLTAAAFTYGPVYNQVVEVRDYDYGGTALLRLTRTEYENSPDYTNRHIFNLVRAVEVYAADGIRRVSRTEYTYDGAPLQEAPGVVQHDAAYNPYAPVEQVCGWEPDPTDPDFINPGCYQWNPQCDGYVPDVYICRDYNPYNPATAARGNLTSVRRYADAARLSGAITETRTYDVTGNLVVAATSCCEQTSFSYTAATQYAYPTQQRRGAADPQSPARLTMAATYDFNTGLALTATDANGRTTQTSYDAATLRPQTTTLPTGAATVYVYDEAAMTIRQTTVTATGETAAQSLRHLNGRGQVRREEALGAGGLWDIVETQYDKLGRVWRQTRPYRSGEMPQWGTTEYDALGRVTRLRAPDGSESRTYYNEGVYPEAAVPWAAGQTTRTVDAWGRERWGRTDSSGRLVEVVEPNPDSAGSVLAAGSLATRYSYDTLGRLVQVEQGAQQRRFQYDSLGRLTHQKLAEASATLNDAGQYVGAGQWSEVLAYDERSNLVWRVDARGVKTVFSYNSDPLNRLQSVSYDLSGAGAGEVIHPAAAISYQYMTTGDLTRLQSVTAAGVSVESFDYDAEGRLNARRLTLASRPLYPLTTEYAYDSLDRVTDVRYPAQYGMANAPRKLIHHDYDVASRVSDLKVDGADYASQIAYNASSQTTSLKVGTGPNQVTETYGYDPATGLLSGQRVQRAGATLLDLTYDYLREGTSTGRTGQLTKIINNLNRDKDRSYGYDALGRLVTATGGAARWTQTYTYDRYGNRTSVTAAGTQAGMAAPEEPAVELPTDLLALRVSPQLPELFGSQAVQALSDSPSFAGALPLIKKGKSETSHSAGGAGYAAPNPQSSAALVAYWAFDEGSGTTAADQTGNGNVGTLQGPGWAAGHTGGGLNFDGIDDYVSVVRTTSVSAVADDFTLAFWVSPRSPHEIDGESTEGYAGVAGQRYVWGPHKEPNGEAGAGVSVGTNGVGVYEHADDYMPATLVYQTTISGWTHIALVYENKQPRLYVNGVLVKTGLTSPRAHVRIQPEEVGGMSYGHFDGQLDDVRIYRGVLSAGEIQALAGTTLPAPWASQDVGSTGIAGSAGYSSGTFTVSGAGADIWDTADAFRFVYQTLAGDGQIVARVADLQNTHPNAKAGVMMRESLTPGSRHALMNVTPGAGLEFLRRTATGGETTWSGASGAAPRWVKLVRSGNTYSGYVSGDGASWTLVGSETITMGSTVYVGLAVTSHDNGLLAAATFANVAVSLAAPNNPPAVSITSPANLALFRAPAKITIAAAAQDSDGGVSRVDFYDGATLIGTDETAPFSITWNNAPSGSHVLTAKATDNQGAVTTSNPVTVIVNVALKAVTGEKIAFSSSRDGNYEIYVMDTDGSNQVNLTNSPADDELPIWSRDGSKMAFRSTRDGNYEIYVMNADGTNLTRLTNHPGTDTPRGWSPDGTKILFSSDRDGNPEVYVMNADGTNQTNLTNNPTPDGGAVWSPDGTKIAFNSERDGNREIYLMNVDGSNQTNISNNAAHDYWPSWSPDGSKIAFTSSRDGNWEIYVMNADGSGQTRLTNSPGDDRHAGWSPDGRRITFRSTRDGQNEIYVMEADGSRQLRLTNNPAIDVDPAWQPPVSKGGKIAFYSGRDGQNEIYVMNADGSGQTRLTFNGAYDAIPKWSPDGSRIAFRSDRDGNLEVYVMNADGSNPTRLTNNPAEDLFQGWSPDGEKILFSSTRDGNREIYVMNADGSNQTRLTNNPAVEAATSWSPDGSKIAFYSNRDGQNEVYVMNADGSNQIRLTNNAADDYYPVWSPDGSKILFSSARDGNYEVYVMNADGSNQTRLTNNPGEDSRASWSPDGSRIAFRSNRDGNLEIYVMNADGSAQTRITNNPAADAEPSWQPPVSKIAFGSSRDGQNEIYVMNADGTGQVRLTNNPADDNQPYWSPDGSRIAFQSNRDGNYEIYVMNADGSNPVRLTNNPSNDTQPVWSPDGSRIAFISDRDGNNEAYVINADGSNPLRLTNNPADDKPSGWSPDGEKILFSSTRDGNREIYVMNADGSNQTRLTNNPADDGTANWSPDGSKLVFRSTRDGNNEVYVMNADGSNPTRLTSTPASEIWPRWSPDGRRVSFTSNRDGNNEVYVMNADGSGQTRLTNNPAIDTAPAWQLVLDTQLAPPAVSIISPSNGATFAAPANIPLSASVLDSDSNIARVDFYQGSTLIGTATTSPYQVTWSNVGTGTYSLTAVATDLNNLTSTSSPITIVVNNSPPTVTLTSPVPNTTHSAGFSLMLAASASDPDGTITKVEFFEGSNRLGEDTTAPYTFIWSSVPNGAYTLTAKATDDRMAVGVSSPVAITVSDPLYGGSHDLADCNTIAGWAWDQRQPNTPISVDVLIDGNFYMRVLADVYRPDLVSAGIGDGRHGFSLATPVWLRDGVTHSITVRPAGASFLLASTPRSLTCAPPNQPPVAEAGGPYSGTAGQPVPFNGTMSTDPDGTITAFQWDFGDGTGGTGATPSHVYAAAGTYTVRLTVTDNRGATASDTAQVNVVANQPPVASAGGPYTGTAGQAIQFNSAGSTDVDGTLTSYQWDFGDGTGGTGTTPSHVYAAAGTYTVRLTVIDNLGAQTTATTTATINPAVLPVPRDGFSALTYDAATNRITSAGFAYDAAGNQTTAPNPAGAPQHYEYDAANRLVKVRDQYGFEIASYVYGAGNQRLIAQDGRESSNQRTYYVWGGGAVIAEYSESPQMPTTPRWTRNYIYLGNRLLATHEAAGSSEQVQYHHPDRLGTRVVTNATTGGWYEQVTLPFGVALNGESSGATNRRFTTYERSAMTGLDYAVNRHYDSMQGRFTQVDPIGAGASSLGDPQSWNMYSYVGNDPINRTDPDGLFWGKLFKFFKKALNVLKWVAIAVTVAVAVLTILPFAWTIPVLAKINSVLGTIGIMGFGEGAAGGVSLFKVTGALIAADAAVGAIANHLRGDKKRCGNKNIARLGLSLLMLQGGGSDKIPSDLEGDYECSSLDSCAELGEKIRDLTKSVRIRRRELDPDTVSYPGHAKIWARQKNILNRCIQKFKEKGCGDSDMPPGSPLGDAISEAGAKAPATRGLGDFIRRGGLIIPEILLCTVNPALCGSILVPKPGTGRMPVPVPAH
jgi:RHS repeat-associated protein